MMIKIYKPYSVGYAPSSQLYKFERIQSTSSRSNNLESNFVMNDIKLLLIFVETEFIS